MSMSWNVSGIEEIKCTMNDNSNEFSHWCSIQSKMHRLFVHDLKNPISALSANLSFLETALDGEAEEVLGAVSDSILAAEMLLKFAENLNLIAMLETGETCALSRIDLETFIRVAIRRDKKFAESAGVHLRIEEPLANAAINWQFRFVEMALENLILSAIRHSPQGSEVIISSKVGSDEVGISVRDHGRPVDEELVDSLLSRESQSEAKKNSGSRYGRGLGLYAAGLAARALDGRIDIGVSDGMSEFILCVPLALAAEE